MRLLPAGLSGESNDANKQHGACAPTRSPRQSKEGRPGGRMPEGAGEVGPDRQMDCRERARRPDRVHDRGEDLPNASMASV